MLLYTRKLEFFRESCPLVSMALLAKKITADSIDVNKQKLFLFTFLPIQISEIFLLFIATLSRIRLL